MGEDHGKSTTAVRIYVVKKSIHRLAYRAAGTIPPERNSV